MLEMYREAVLRIKNAVLKSRYKTAANANADQLALYYSIGGYVSTNTRSGKWGSGAIEAISAQLQEELPGLRGFSPTHIKSMRIFYEEWVDCIDKNRQLLTAEILGDDTVILIRQLPTAELESERVEAFLRVGFTHHREIIAKCKDPDERWYYLLRCAYEYWTVDALKSHIRAADYQHYGQLPNNFSLVFPDDKTAARAVRSFKDEYLLDYVNIDEEADPELIDERVFCREIVSDITKFIMSMGRGFAIIGTNHRLLVEKEEFFCDILLFNRDLNCLVAIELKRGKFKPSYLGQLSFYLSALDKLERRPEEGRSIGLLLCKEISAATVELAIQDYNKPMGVATYKTAKDIPAPYQALAPVVEGVKKILGQLP